MSAPVVEPSACKWCGIARRGHGRQFADAAGWHEWEQPSQEQILARMKARRLAVTVAREGAVPVPVPVGPEPQTLSSEQRAQIAELIGAAKPATDQLLLEVAQQIRDRREHDHSTAADWDWYCLNASGWLGDRAPTVLRRLLDAEARVAELEATTHVAPSPSCTRCYGADAVRFVANGGATAPCRVCGPTQVEQLQARVAELEAERRVTNATLDDAAEALRGREPREVFAERAERETHSGRRTAYRMLAQEDPHDSPLHHDYRVSRDLPETGGTP